MKSTMRKCFCLTGVTFALLFSSTASIHAEDKGRHNSPLSTGDTPPARELADKFNGLAGSPGNADSLVKGLRTGSPVTLSSGATRSMFSPPTKPMGFGNINIALSRAQSELSSLGIRHPSPAQLQAALKGGLIMTAKGVSTLPGVLALRKSGQGWGQIAHRLGFKLGEVVRPMKAEQAVQHHHQNDKSAHNRVMPTPAMGTHGANIHPSGFDRSHGSDHGGFSGRGRK